MAGRWRWIVHPPADGAWNMAVDEALLRSTTAAGGDALPILRLYGWSPPALSLGRAQPSDGAHDPAYLRREAIDLVRRPTGGGAVLHEHERTYAVVAPTGGPFGRTLRETYAAVAAALVDAYRRLGVSVDRSEARGGPPGTRPARETLCFARASVDEIVFRGRKARRVRTASDARRVPAARRDARARRRPPSRGRHRLRGGPRGPG